MHPCSGKPDRGCRESGSAYRSRICRAARQDRKGTDGPGSDVRFWSASRLTSWSRTEQRIELASSQLEGVGRLSLPTLPSLTESTGLLVATLLPGKSGDEARSLQVRSSTLPSSSSQKELEAQSPALATATKRSRHECLHLTRIVPYSSTDAGGERSSPGRRDRFESCASTFIFLFGYA